MNKCGGNYVCSVLLVVVVEVGCVLVVVCVKLSACNCVVGQYIIIVNGNLKIVAFLSELVLYKFEYLAVRCSCCTDLDNVVCVCRASPVR